MFRLAFVFWFLMFLAVEAMLGILAVPAWINFAAIFFLVNNGLWLFTLMLVNSSHRTALDSVERIANKSMETVDNTSARSHETASLAIQGTVLVAVAQIETSREGLKKALETGKAEWVLKLADGRTGPVRYVDQQGPVRS